MKKLFWILAVYALILWIPKYVHADLVPSGGLVYDDHWNSVWFQDANYALTSGTDPYGEMDGLMDYESAVNWLKTVHFMGRTWSMPFEDWLLDLAGYYNISSATPWPFLNLQDGWYWTSSSSLYHFGTGAITTRNEVKIGYVIGMFMMKMDPIPDPNTVPEPSTTLLLGVCVIGLTGLRRMF